MRRSETNPSAHTIGNEDWLAVYSDFTGCCHHVVSECRLVQLLVHKCSTKHTCMHARAHARTHTHAHKYTVKKNVQMHFSRLLHPHKDPKHHARGRHEK